MTARAAPPTPGAVVPDDGEAPAGSGRRLCVLGRRTHVTVLGDGPDLVLLHGLGSFSREILLPLRGLARRYRVIAIDRPGYGRSAPLPADGNWPWRQTDWLEATLALLRVERGLVLAHSIGATLALMHALRSRRIAGLVLVAPFCRPTRREWMLPLRGLTAPVLGPALRRLLLPAFGSRLARRHLRAAFAPNPVPAALAARAAAPSAAALLTMATELRAFAGAAAFLDRNLPGLTTPVTALVGEADRGRSFRGHAEWLCRRAGAPSRLVRVASAGHMLHHAAPRTVRAAVDELAGRVALGR